jgi:hypothetical protein
MKLTVNEPYIKKRAKIAMYLSWGSMLALILAMVASFRVKPDSPNYRTWIMVSFAGLLIGILMANIGTYNVRKFGRKPRPDQMIASTLERLDNRYHFYSWSTPSPYVLQTPAGCYLFITRDLDGKVSYKNGKWKSAFSWKKLLNIFGQEGMGNPKREAKAEKEALEKYLKERFPDAEIPVFPVLVFLNPKVSLELEGETEPPAVEIKDLRKFLREDIKARTLLPSGVQKQMDKLCAEES